MRIRVAKVGTRNRVVLPPEVLDVLGVHPGDPLFFIIRGQSVRLSRSPEDFGEYLLLHSESLPAPEDLDEVDPRQMRFGWMVESGSLDE
jgi:bifunctional DNA-binding transcriptional regulator/antitoxin component of YhaV-PrlF toxin-antitoxin module